MYNSLPPSTACRLPETTLARLTALNDLPKEATFSDYNLAQNNTVFATPRRTRAEITRCINSLDGVVDITEPSSCDSASSGLSGRRMARASTKFQHRYKGFPFFHFITRLKLSYPIRGLPSELFPEFEVDLLNLYISTRLPVASALVHLRKRHFYDVMERDHPFPNARNLLFYIGLLLLILFKQYIFKGNCFDHRALFSNWNANSSCRLHST